ncbi:hypothetical protein PG984_014089 [Apiospora sp. TS-2023a]
MASPLGRITAPLSYGARSDEEAPVLALQQLQLLPKSSLGHCHGYAECVFCKQSESELRSKMLL